MTDTDFANNHSLLANTLAQVKSLLYSLEQATRGIDFHVNADQSSSVLTRRNHLHFKRPASEMYIPQSAVAVEYTDSFSAEE